MFLMNIRFQLAALAILAMIMIDFFKFPHLKLLSTKYFAILLGFTTLYLGFDILTVYTVNHQDVVPPELNRAAHQTFIGLMIVLFFMIYMYVSVISVGQKRICRIWFSIVFAPIVVSMVLLFTGKITYHTTPYGNYSTGPVAYWVYLCAVGYLVSILVITVNPKNALTVHERYSIRVGMSIWAICLVVQIVYPYILLSGLGIVIIIFSLYLSFESNKENIDLEFDCFNRNAYRKMISEYYESNGDVTFINVAVENLSEINTMHGYPKGILCLHAMKNMIEENLSSEVYRSRDNRFSILLKGAPASYEEELQNLRDAIQEDNDTGITLKVRIDVMDVRQYARSLQDVEELMRFMNRAYSIDVTTDDANSIPIIHYMNQALVDRKNRRDRIHTLLVEALANDTFEMVYQPIYWPSIGMFASAEALLRMPVDEMLGYVSPEEFIPIAEENGLILAIGDKVIEMVCQFLQENNLWEKGMKYMELNLSGVQISSAGMESRVQEIVTRYGIEPSFLNLEITETAAVKRDGLLEANMRGLRASGFHFSMDDFGTGFSNLALMMKENYDLVKLDKSLIWPVFDKGNVAVERSEQLLRHIISMLHDTSVPIVAEGVETQEMAQYLVAHGVEHLQGYYYSKPISAEDYVKFLSK